MQYKSCLGVAATLLCAAFSPDARLMAQEAPAAAFSLATETPRYIIRDLGTLGGPSSAAYDVNDYGLLSGAAALPNGTSHAVLWYGEAKLDIASPGLDGTNSAGLNSVAFTANHWVQAVGGSEISRLDPNGENFCGYNSGLSCLPFIWELGRMSPLPTLGGTNGQAISINNRGQIVGVAEKNSYNAACAAAVPSQVLDYGPVLWRVWPSGKRELPLLPGDSAGVGLWINDRGQAIGQSGSCANTTLPPLVVGPHAVLWDSDGSVRDLGNLGGECLSLCASPVFGPLGNTPLYINNLGHVFGTSVLPGESSQHAFRWTKEAGKMQDLGTIAGDAASVALGANEKEEVVGLSFDATGSPRGFLYKNGVMMDLNALIPGDASLFAIGAEVINERGEIAGFGVQTSTGDVHGFLAIPCTAIRAQNSWCSGTNESASAAAMHGENRVVPASARKQLQNWSRGYHLGRAQ